MHTIFTPEDPSEPTSPEDHPKACTTSTVTSLSRPSASLSLSSSTFPISLLCRGLPSPNNINNHGWQKVTYTKRQRKVRPKPSDSVKVVNGSAVSGGDSVFQSLEKQSEEQGRRIDAQKAAISAAYKAPVRSVNRNDDNDSDVEGSGGEKNGNVAEKKTKSIF